MTSVSSKFLLDTNVFLAYVRGGLLGTFVEEKYSLRRSGFQPLICVVTVGEVRAFAPRNHWAAEKTERMNALLDEVVWIDISEPEVLDAYVEVLNSRPKGLTIPQNDMWIAAATHATGACLLTTDGHFDYVAENKFIRREKIPVDAGKNR